VIAIARGVSLAVVLACLALGAVVPETARAQEPDRPLFTWQDGLLAGGFVGLTVAARPLDKHFALKLQQPRAQENVFLQKAAVGFRTIAAPGTVIIGSGLYIGGRLIKSERMASLGLHGSEAILIGEGLSWVMKGIFGRERPYVDPDGPNPSDWQLLRGFHAGGDYRSFPSGHTVAAFAAAAAVTSETGEWWPDYQWLIGTAMYSGASLVGVSRMYNNRHWASDVLTGAAIGTFAGTKVVRYNRTHPGNRVDRWFLNVRVAPSAETGRTVSLSLIPASRTSSRFAR
jgi:membrane-associated phospholipid phosphatase